MEPLHNAAWHNSTKTAELLILKGADVNAKENKGRTPLKLAVETKSNGMIELLKKHGAKE